MTNATATIAPADSDATADLETVIVTDSAVIVSPTDALIADYVTQLHDWEVPYERHHVPAAGVWRTVESRWPGRSVIDYLFFGLY